MSIGRIRIYKPHYDQNFDDVRLRRGPFEKYDLDPEYWARFYEFAPVSEVDALTKELDELRAKVKELELEQVDHIEILNNLWSEKLTAWREQAEKLGANLRDCLANLIPYSVGCRDKSFVGWEREWKTVPIKYESDYEYYPNHIPKEEIEALELVLSDYAAFKKERGEG